MPVVAQRVERDPLLDINGLDRHDQAASEFAQHTATLARKEQPFRAIKRMNVSRQNLTQLGPKRHRSL